MNCPDLGGRLPSLAEYMHIIFCDACEKRYDAQVVAYGNAIVAMNAIAGAASWN